MDGQLVGVRGAGLYAALTQRAHAPRLVLLTVGRQAPPRLLLDRPSAAHILLLGWCGFHKH